MIFHKTFKIEKEPGNEKVTTYLNSIQNTATFYPKLANHDSNVQFHQKIDHFSWLAAKQLYLSIST